MILIDKKVIEENQNSLPNSFTNYILVDDLLTNSKEVEVVDIDKARGKWLEDIDFYDDFEVYLRKNYQLIKIKK